MEILLSTDQSLLRDTARKFLESQVPLTAVRGLESNLEGFERDWWRDASEFGWTSLLVPEHLGGGSVSEHGLLDLVLIAEEFGRAVGPGPLLPVNVVAAALSRSDNRTMCDEILPGLMSGREIAAWAFYEGGGAWDGQSVKLRAERGGSHFELTGQKTMVEAGYGADHYFVTALTDEGLMNCILPAGSPGLTVTPMQSLDLVRRFAHLDFDHVLVSDESVLAGPDEVEESIAWLLRLALVLQCHETNGAISRVFEMTLDYAENRYAFGRTLGSYQALKHRFADMKMWLEGCHGIATHAARAVANGTADSRELTCAAKAYVGERSTDLIEDCVQLHGGIGVTWEHDLHLYLRRATTNRVTYGTPQEHREQIARLLDL